MLIAGVFSITHAQEVIDPSGIFFNRINGAVNTFEWFQISAINGENRYNLSNIFGEGFDATITSEGVITLDNGVGGGNFSDPDNFVIMLTIDGASSTFTANRTAFTAPDFPLQLDTPRPANPLFVDDWNNSFIVLNPATGAGAAPNNETIAFTTNANSLRIIDPAGVDFFQGVFENATDVAFRSITPSPSGVFASFPGSDTQFFDSDLLGQGRFLNINEFEAIFLIQSRAGVQPVMQQLLRFVSVRANPLPLGDLNGDRFVNATDRDLLVDQMGLDIEDDVFNLAADIDNDGVITPNDLAVFDTGLPLEIDFSIAEGAWLNTDTNGEGILFDFGPSLDLLFMAWFTFTLEAAEVEIPSPVEIGFAGQRWMTGLLSVNRNTAMGALRARQAGAFDMPPTALETGLDVGEVSIEFLNCDLARVTYAIDSAGVSSSFEIEPLEKVVNPTGFSCSL